MHASVHTFTLLGVEARDVTVEVDVAQGLPAFAIVGLPDAAVRESRERVRAAIVNSGFEFPQRRITASLAPADLRKGGPGFDLAIAAALLAACEALPSGALDGCALAGELALDGAVRAVPGALAMAESAARAGARRLVVAAANAAEAALPARLNGAHPAPAIVPVERLGDLRTLPEAQEREPAPPPGPAAPASLPDLADLRGQPALRRALELAAAGGHGLLVLGPPGAGKSMAARRLPSIMPPLGASEALEVMRIASACGRLAGRPAEIPARPFRAPHHTISPAGLVGGGSPPRPGEITLAHRGVLFLDELGEFSRTALEALRQPLEDGSIVIVRAGGSVELPCRFVLVAAANPCPCGRGEEAAACECTPGEVRRYRARLSGALADRMDISLAIEQPTPEALAAHPPEDSAAVRERVVAARERAAQRQGGRCNAELEPHEARRLARMTPAARQALAGGHRALALSGRGHDRVLRVALTLADLAGAGRVDEEHVIEALGLRRRMER